MTRFLCSTIRMCSLPLSGGFDITMSCCICQTFLFLMFHLSNILFFNVSSVKHLIFNNVASVKHFSMYCLFKKTHHSEARQRRWDQLNPKLIEAAAKNNIKVPNIHLSLGNSSKL